MIEGQAEVNNKTLSFFILSRFPAPTEREHSYIEKGITITLLA
jgi:hypothetical protein